jgi:hypothetical protein
MAKSAPSLPSNPEVDGADMMSFNLPAEFATSVAPLPTTKLSKRSECWAAEISRAAVPTSGPTA